MMLAGLPSPPDPVITRWKIWLRAALCYSENLPAVRTIVSNWTSAGLLVSRAKDAINVEDLVPDLVKINQYRTLAANVEFLEGSACTITEAYGLLKNMQFHGRTTSNQFGGAPNFWPKNLSLL